MSNEGKRIDVVNVPGQLWAFYGAVSGALNVYVSPLVKDHSPEWQPVAAEIERCGLVETSRETVEDPNMYFGEAMMIEYGQPS